jgi:cobalt-zinc-cadmium resistance protein CzcA
MDRSVLVEKTTSTVMKNLIEGGLIVVFVLVLLLGNFRAGLIVASMIPLAMLFAFILMNLFGVSANLMSLGAIDFGIVVDGAVIIVEAVMHVLHKNYLGKKLTRGEMEEVVVESSRSIIQSAAFGVLIILLVFVPIMTLTGIEGKMFKPMAQTVSFALIGALLLSLTYVPMMSAIFMKRKIHAHENFSDKLIKGIKRVYRPLLEKSLAKPRWVISTAFVGLLGSIGLFMTMGGEFIPTLEEGDLAMQMTLKPGSSLQESVKKTNQAEEVLLKNFPEVKHVVAKIGTAEVPTDPMAMEDCDIMIIMKDKDEWTSASSREEMVEKMKEKLSVIKGVNFEFSQPIQLRFNELMTGAKTDVSVKIFGENMDTLKKYADKAAEIIKRIEGAGDVKVEQTEGLLQWRMQLKYDRLGQYHVDVSDVNRVIRTAFGGEQAGVVYENERKFDVVVRMSSRDRVKAELSSIYVNSPDGQMIPLTELVELVEEESPMLISREDAKRRINIGVNVRNRDVASLVEEIDQAITAKVKLPSGYSVKYGGQFENLEKAKQRLSIAVPVALLLIFVLLYFAFGSFKYATLVFAAVPLSAIGGIFALWLRDMPFSISAGVGFIALFGVAVLNGIVLISYFNQLKEEGRLDLKDLILEGGLTRLRPVIMTAAVASLGFLPMALSNSSGAEVQKPLATVVIGGLVSATILTLLVMPVIYFLAEQKRKKGIRIVASVSILLFFSTSLEVSAQQTLTKTQAIEHAWANHPRLKNAGLQVQEVEAGKGQNKTLAPLEIVFQQGQINYAERDYYIEANQNLGNFVSWFRLEERMRMQVLEAKSQEQLLRKEIALKVSLAYAEWKFSENNLREIDSLVLLFSEAQKRMEKRKSIGDVDPLEYGFLLVQLEEMQNRKVLAQVSLEQARRYLKWEAWLPDSLFAPAMENTKLSEESKRSIDSVLLSPSAGKISIQEAETRYLKSQYAPDWMIGYFNQSLEQQNGYWGVRAGISIPLWSWSTSSKIKQSQIRREILSNELDMLQTQLHLDLQQYIAQEKSLAQRMSETVKSSGDMHVFKKAAFSKYLSGDIPFISFVQAMNVYFQNRMSVLQLEREWENIQAHIAFLTIQS